MERLFTHHSGGVWFTFCKIASDVGSTRADFVPKMYHSVGVGCLLRGSSLHHHLSVGTKTGWGQLAGDGVGLVQRAGENEVVCEADRVQDVALKLPRSLP